MDNFKKLKQLGKGAFGTVYKVQDKTERICVMKVYKEDKDPEDSTFLGMSLEHPNLMKCETFFYDRIVTGETHYSRKSTVHFIAILEYIEGNDLRQLLQKDFLQTLYNMNFYLEQIIAGLKYLHDRDIIHRDIKPENIMISKGKVKIIDYDFLIKVNPNLRSKSGTPYYLSPELHQRMKYDTRTDLWSLGVTLYFCFNGCYPFNGNTKEELKQLILSDYTPDFSNLSPKYITICKGLLQKDYNDRISLDDVLKELKT